MEAMEARTTARRSIAVMRRLVLAPVPSDHHGFIPSSAEDLLRRRVKMELRKRMRGLRGVLPAATCAEKSARLVDRLVDLPPVRGARSIALFWPLGERREVDLRAADASLRARGVRVAYPSVTGDGSLSFRFVADPEAMTHHALGLREPPADAPPATELDVIVVPALAVDPRGHRIGYGAGHYDRALAALEPGVVSVAVAFDFQLLAEIPNTEGDVAVRWVVTDERTLEAERPPAG
jgi:5-formyltetrahydrofolate cyclo-ligase